jgi:nitrate reductase NapE component
VAAISKQFELESWDWAHSLRLFELLPIVIYPTIKRPVPEGLLGIVGAYGFAKKLLI